MSFKEYAEYDGLGLAELVRNGDVTPSELIECAIERIERHNPALNAVVHKAYDEARTVASGELPKAPFAGVPFLIKDLGVHVKGWPLTSGSRYTAGEVSTDDSELIRRHRAAGLVLLGKTNTPEFGITGTTESAYLGPCRNPWNPDHISGGSSGGAASAVAAGIVPLAHASDGLGSIRIPAACCGLFGMKTTRDRNPNGADDYGRAIGMSVDHVVTRSVRDSAAMLDATGYPEQGSPFAPAPKERPYLEELKRPTGAFKIAFSSETPRGKPIDPENQAALEATVQLLQDLGHEVVERGLGIDYRAFYQAQATVSAANAAAGYARRVAQFGREAHEDELEKLTWAGIRRGQTLSGEQTMTAWQDLRVLGRRILSIFEDVDIFLSPVLGTSVPKVGLIDPVTLEPREVNKHQSKAFPFTPPMNITGQPAMSVPLFQDSLNLPIGMMFAARYGDEASLFRLAAQLEEARPWIARKPPIWA